MPASITDITRTGVYVILEAVLPERAARNIAILLIDPVKDRAWVRTLENFQDLAGEEDAEVLEQAAKELPGRASEDGAEAFLQSLEDSLSNVLRVSERRNVEVDAFSRVADRLFSEHVEKIAVQPFSSHVPLYSLKAAAGDLGEEMESNVEDWVRPPEGVRVDRDLFVAHVVGDSMEPRIPAGSLNLFRFHPVGSRQNKILLIQRFGVTDETARYTVKKYTSRKTYRGEDQWEHEQIRLEPLNPKHSAWDVGPEDFAVVAEWLRVIE